MNGNRFNPPRDTYVLREVTNNSTFCLFAALGLLYSTFILVLPDSWIFTVRVENMRLRGASSFFWTETVGGKAGQTGCSLNPLTNDPNEWMGYLSRCFEQCRLSLPPPGMCQPPGSLLLRICSSPHSIPTRNGKIWDLLTAVSD